MTQQEATRHARKLCPGAYAVYRRDALKPDGRCCIMRETRLETEDAIVVERSLVASGSNWQAALVMLGEWDEERKASAKAKEPAP